LHVQDDLSCSTWNALEIACILLAICGYGKINVGSRYDGAYIVRIHRSTHWARYRKM